MSRSHLAALVVLAVVAPLPWLYHDLAQLGESILFGLAVGVTALALGGIGTATVKRSTAAQAGYAGGAYEACGCSKPKGLAAVPEALSKGDTWASWHTCVHEAGHHGVGVTLGARCRSVVGKNPGDGGFCRLLSGWFRDPVDNIAFLLGGQMAAGKSWGDWGDNDNIKAFLQNYKTQAEADAALDLAEQRARYALRKSSAFRGHVATILHHRGWYQ